MVLEEIIEKAAELTLPNFLKWLVASGILAKVGKSQLNKVNQIIRDKYNEGTYAFVPDKKEAETLKKIKDQAIYKEFKRLLPGHWGIDVVRTAIYINVLERKGNVEKIKEIKDQVFKNKKLPGIRLVEMVVVGVINPVLDRLKELKDKHNYSQDDVANDFEDLLYTWEKITIFVKNENTSEEIIKLVKEKIDKKESTFFMLAKGNAINIACEAIVTLNKEKYLLEKGYIWLAEQDPHTKPATYHCGFHSTTFLM